MTKHRNAMADAIEDLLAAGFIPDGQTRDEVVRLPTRRVPLLGASGGELAKFGGRQRFAQPGTGVKATVGPRTTAIYLVEPGRGLGGVRAIGTHDTDDLQAIRATLAGLVPQ